MLRYVSFIIIIPDEKVVRHEMVFTFIVTQSPCRTRSESKIAVLDVVSSAKVEVVWEPVWTPGR